MKVLLRGDKKLVVLKETPCESCKGRGVVFTESNAYGESHKVSCPKCASTGRGV